MTTLTDDLAKLTGAQQIEVLKNLTQQGAAFLLGLSPRCLRDHPESPRSADGTYDARALLSSGMLHRDLPELSVDELEKAFAVAEEFVHQITPPILRFMRGIRERHSDAGLSAVLVVMLDYWAELVDDNETEPTDQQIREKLESEIDARLQSAQRDRLHQQLKVAVRCEHCGKLRRGREWLKARTPVGYVEAGSICPSCDKKPAPKNLDEALEVMAERAAASVGG